MMKQENSGNELNPINQNSSFQTNYNHIQNDEKSIKIMKYDIINVSNSFSTLKKVAPDIITDKMVETLFAQLFKRYGKNENLAKSFFQQTIQTDKKYNLSKNREKKQNGMNGQSKRKESKELTHQTEDRQYAQLQALEQPPAAKQYKKKLVARSFCFRNRSFAALQDQIFQNNQKIHIGKDQYERLLSGILIQSYQRLQQFLTQHCRKTIDPLDSSFFQALVKTVSNCRIFFAGQVCQTLFNIIKGIYQLQIINPVKEDDAVKLYEAIMQELKGEFGMKSTQNKYKQPDQYQNKNLKASQTGRKQKDQITIMKDKFGVECLTKVKSSQKEGREFELSSYWSGTLQQKLLNLYCQQHNFTQIKNQFIELYPMGKELFTTAAIRSQFNKIIRVAIRKLIYFTNTFGKGKLPELIKLNDNRVKIIIYHNQGYFIRKLLIQIYRKDVYDHKVLSRLINCINEFSDKHSQLKSRGERSDQHENDNNAYQQGQNNKTFSKSFKSKFKHQNGKGNQGKNKEQLKQPKKKMKRFNARLPLRTQVVYKGSEEGQQVVQQQQEITENINEWLEDEYK